MGVGRTMLVYARTTADQYWVLGVYGEDDGTMTMAGRKMERRRQPAESVTPTRRGTQH